ncbi:MAG: radical SAM family heme chaperone HemW [Thermodesulfobacteriota bacterium]|nr:radical SAM family heme chaperone HemW [Thermodesulfobacteriota bacterium]
MSPPGLYVHIPFCRSKCPYCAFYSIASRSLIPQWLDALRQEIRHYEGRFNRFDSLYLGGGTPTILASPELARMVEDIFAQFDFAPDSEITIEANPCDLTDEKINMLGDLGFNRISLGVQSFDDRILSFLGRRHTGREAENALRKLRSSGFQNIGVDLMYAFAGQSMSDWIDTLKQAIGFQPEHLSCYQLSIEKKTLFGRLAEKGLIQSLSEAEESSYFLTTSEFLKDHGYVHYEISNFARQKKYFSRHNQKYWHHVSYLGLGPSAHSFDGSRRWWNVRSIKKYCDDLQGGKTPVEGHENLSDEQLRVESIALGLRTIQGFDLDKSSHNPQANATILRLQESGLVQLKNNRVIPTKRGFLVADRLAVECA